tara:strand:+ start:139 stop:825 length:687 start_codon:yes stop_codon:yes gene_type:complete
MNGDKKVVAIIPARGGSKRLPGKNIRLLNGVSLIVYTINVAQKCVGIDKIIVSTDSDEIAQVALSSGVEVDRRSKELSSDNATTIDVVKEFLIRSPGYDICVILQPTSPLRNVEDLQGSLDLFQKKNADAVISVCKAEHPPQWTNTIGSGGEMDNFLSNQDKNIRSQSFGSFYRLNGAIYCGSSRRLIKEASPYFDSKTYAYIMPRQRSIDIDTINDFELAEYYVSKL